MGQAEPDADSWSTAPLGAIASTLHPLPMFWKELKTEDRVIDIGCGFGSLVRELHARGCSRARGLDINHEVIREASRHAAAAGLDDVFVVGDARATPFAAAAFDVAVVQALLTVVEKRGERLAILREVKRILDPRGFLYLGDFAQAWHSPIYSARYRTGAAKYGELGTFDAVSRETGERLYVAHHFAEREFVRLIRKACFRIREFRYRRVSTRSGNHIYGMFVIATPARP